MSPLLSLGHPRPICLPWASLALFRTLFSHGLLLTSLASLAQLLHAHSWGLWACHQSPTLFTCIALSLPRPILTFFSHHILPMDLLFAISLFSGSYEPICFLKAYLLILWTYYPLFLPLGPNGFCSLSFANFFLFCVAGLGFLPFIQVPQKRPSTKT